MAKLISFGAEMAYAITERVKVESGAYVAVFADEGATLVTLDGRQLTKLPDNEAQELAAAMGRYLEPGWGSCWMTDEPVSADRAVSIVGHQTRRVTGCSVWVA